CSRVRSAPARPTSARPGAKLPSRCGQGSRRRRSRTWHSARHRKPAPRCTTSEMADNVELVRQLWSAFERGGIEAVLEIADRDVEWEPYGGGGTVYHGHEGLRAYMEEHRARD